MTVFPVRLVTARSVVLSKRSVVSQPDETHRTVIARIRRTTCIVSLSWRHCTSFSLATKVHKATLAKVARTRGGENRHLIEPVTLLAERVSTHASRHCMESVQRSCLTSPPASRSISQSVLNNADCPIPRASSAFPARLILQSSPFLP